MPAFVQRRFGARGFQEVGEAPIAASQTFIVGDVLTQNVSGLAQQGASATNRIGATTVATTNAILGVANADAQARSGDPTIPYTKLSATFVIARAGTQFEVPIYHGTASSAYPNPNQIGVPYEAINATLPNAAGGQTMYCVDLQHTTNVKWFITDFDAFDYPGWPKVGQATPPSSGTTSQYCTCWAEFIGSQCAYQYPVMARS